MHLKRISPNCLTTQTVYEGVRGAPGAVKIGIAQTQKDPHHPPAIDFEPNLKNNDF